jgi:hypothetical protein
MLVFLSELLGILMSYLSLYYTCYRDLGRILAIFYAMLSLPMSHPGSRNQNRSLHTCAQDVQITRTANNMVNRYNISLNYKLESSQNDLWVQKKYYRVAQKSKCRCVFHRHNRRRGRPSLYLLAPAGILGWTPAFCLT